MKQELLEIEKLNIKYRSKNLLSVKEVSFKVREKEIVAILGPSGCGKTTILNAISNLLRPNETEIGGRINLNKNTKINTVFQEPRLLPWRNILQNVSYGLEARGEIKEKALEKARKTIESVGLRDFEDYYPNHVSIGMQQRANFARAIVCNPDLLLLDEPFSALDVKIKHDIQNEFLKILSENNITSIFVTHSIEEAMFLSDRIIILSKRPCFVKHIINKEDFDKEKIHNLMMSEKREEIESN